MNPIVASVRTFFRVRSIAAGKGLPAGDSTRERFFIRPTRYGYIFLAMLTALLLGSVNHNNNLGYILTFLLAGMAVASVFHTRRNISRLSLASARSSPVFAGQTALFAITVKPVHAACPAILFQFSGGEPTTVNLHPGGKPTVQVPLAAPKRGLLKPGVLAVATTYPLGLFEARRTLPLLASCLVYPRPLPGPLLSVPGADDRESEGDAGGSGVDDFSGLENYQAGDPLQHISWKAFSRGQGLYSKKFEGLRGKSIYFNPDVLPGPDFELKLSRVCFMILKAEAMQIPYGLQLGKRIIMPDLGGKHKRQCLRWLALAGRRGA
jgi:uncharacterized protein (DUF58 family)